jgi:hypothetical protein
MCTGVARSNLFKMPLLMPNQHDSEPDSDQLVGIEAVELGVGDRTFWASQGSV